MKYFFCIVLASSLTFSSAQTRPSNRYNIGLSLGSGNIKTGPILLNVDYTYKVKLIQGQLYFDLKSKNKFQIELLFQPQFNFTKFKPIDNKPFIEKGFEFGLNGGFLWRRWCLDKKLSYYAIISAGPHYISGSPSRQSSGFIFSDNFNIGLTYSILDKIILDLRPGFRHISNANLKPKNGGINSITFNIGFIIHPNIF